MAAKIVEDDDFTRCEGFPGAQLMLEYTEANGIACRAGVAPIRAARSAPDTDMLMVSMEISDVAFS